MAFFRQAQRCLVEATYREIKCAFCNTPVLIETAKTNELGQLIHEDCYLQLLQMNGDPSTNSASDSN